MQIQSHTFLVKTEISLTHDELMLCIEASKSHYDFVCRSASIPGHDAFLNGMLNRLKFSETPIDSVSYELTERQLQTLCKILESPLATTEMQRAAQDILLENHRQFRLVNKLGEFANDSNRQEG